LIQAFRGASKQAEEVLWLGSTSDVGISEGGARRDVVPVYLILVLMCHVMIIRRQWHRNGFLPARRRSRSKRLSDYVC